MRKLDVIHAISDKTGLAKVDVLVILETFFSEVKQSVLEGETVSFVALGASRVNT